jgi:hypothetical protein
MVRHEDDATECRRESEVEAAALAALMLFCDAVRGGAAARGGAGASGAAKGVGASSWALATSHLLSCGMQLHALPR